MHAIHQTCPKGPALLARAGVSLADAQWFYRLQGNSASEADAARLESIRRKVCSFLVQ
ncbi:MAG TPA: hypothetical protein VHL79_11120 [Ramlibacter sp.]|nr:hypothetical protein [Ramlibacter sp.]